MLLDLAWHDCGGTRTRCAAIFDEIHYAGA